MLRGQLDIREDTEVKTAREQAENVIERALFQLQGVARLSDMDSFLEGVHGTGPLDSYKMIAAPARNLVQAIAAKSGMEGQRSFLRGALSRAVCNTLTSDRFSRLPPLVAQHQGRHLGRIAHDADFTSEWLDLDHDLYQKEIGLATLRLYAAGAQLIDVRCGIPRSLVYRDGLLAGLDVLSHLLKLGGFRPYFQIHTHTFNLDQFNKQGWNDCYLCCAELYDLHPEVLGMFGSSWYYDPALEAVSPRLSYLRSVPMEGGARAYFMEKGRDAIDNALATSPTRRKLYGANKYHPSSYLLVWGKSRQIAWASRTGALLSQ
jgi:hypothetical protein